MRGCRTTNKQIPRRWDNSMGSFASALSSISVPRRNTSPGNSAAIQRLLRFCSALLRPHGRLYLQSGLFGKRVMDPASLRAAAPKDSEERVCFRLSKIYPRAWLPSDKAQVIACAGDDFKFLASNNGRKDYIETLNRWGDATKEPVPPAQSLAGVLQSDFHDSALSRGIRFRLQVSCVVHNDQQECFKREIMNAREDVFRKEIV